ncbi:post-transcriptional regulator [Amedibacillus sp. YH-ame10]
MSNANEFDEKYIRLAITLKANELRRELSSLTYEHIESTLEGNWKVRKPESIHKALDDINSLTVGEVVAYLSTQAVILGSKMKLHDFEDMFEVKA